MIGALLTCVFWAFSAICGQRAARKLGSTRANVVRLLIAFGVLGTLTFSLYPNSFHHETFWWLILGGVTGFGIGDAALYLALARIGSRLTVLITFCVAPVFGVIGDWLAFGEGPTFAQAAAALLMIAGVCFTLKPTSPLSERYGNVGFGLGCAFVAAAGQGLGAVFSRIAFKEAEALDLELPALSQAFHRILGGVFIALIASFIVLRSKKREDHPKPEW
ncbi:MAG: drug/metabolite transporter (DMT)-like permease, partial [Verrucomicrobiales bacterium]